jgi:4-carboxymuconolactone decarboxylase
MTKTSEGREPSGAERMFGDFAPALVRFTDGVLFGDVWKRPGLSAKERSLVTVAALTAMGNTDQLVFHLDFARRNGNSDDELSEAITHLALAAGQGVSEGAQAVDGRRPVRSA